MADFKRQVGEWGPIAVCSPPSGFALVVDGERGRERESGPLTSCSTALPRPRSRCGPPAWTPGPSGSPCSTTLPSRRARRNSPLSEMPMIFRRPRGAGYEHSQPRPDPPARHEPDNGPQEPATGGDTGPPERRQPVATTNQDPKRRAAQRHALPADPGQTRSRPLDDHLLITGRTRWSTSSNCPARRYTTYHWLPDPCSPADQGPTGRQRSGRAGQTGRVSSRAHDERQSRTRIKRPQKLRRWIRVQWAASPKVEPFSIQVLAASVAGIDFQVPISK